MTTQLAFAFGMLSIVAITMLVAIVVGMVKVIKLGNQLRELQQSINYEVDTIHRNTSGELQETRRNIHDEIQSLRKDVDLMYSATHRRIDDDARTIHDEIAHIHSNIDSRFDKFENRIKDKFAPINVETINGSNTDLVIEKTKKQQLNG